MSKAYTFVFEPLVLEFPRMTLLDAYFAPSPEMAKEYASGVFLSFIRAGHRFSKCEVFEHSSVPHVEGRHVCTITAKFEAKIEQFD